VRCFLVNQSYQTFFEGLSSETQYGVFIDDTGSPGTAPERKTWVGVLVAPDQMAIVLKLLYQQIRELNVSTGATEFHFADIFNGRKEYSSIDWTFRLNIFKRLADIFGMFRFPIFVQSLDAISGPKWRQHWQEKGLPSRVAGFNLDKYSDLALFTLLLRVIQYFDKQQEQQGNEMRKARVFIDEGFKRNGVEIESSLFSGHFLVLQREMTRSRMKGDGGHEEGQRCRSRCGSSSRTSGI